MLLPGILGTAGLPLQLLLLLPLPSLMPTLALVDAVPVDAVPVAAAQAPPQPQPPPVPRTPDEIERFMGTYEALQDQCRLNMLRRFTGNPNAKQRDVGGQLERWAPRPFKWLAAPVGRLRAAVWFAHRYAQNGHSFCTTRRLVRDEALQLSPLLKRRYQQYSERQKALYHACYAMRREDWFNSNMNIFMFGSGPAKEQCFALVSAGKPDVYLPGEAYPANAPNVAKPVSAAQGNAGKRQR